MIIKKLHLQNIRSYEDIEIEFNKGSTLLTGEIGSGKTSILLGIQFALFGLQPGQKGSSLLRYGSNEAYARIEIEVDNQTINIERTIKKSKSGSITQEKNILTTNSERTDLSTSEMKNRVISILQYPKEFAKKSNLLYKFTVYTPQEEMKDIIIERPEVRLDTIRHIFGIDRYKRIKENANIILQKIKESVKIKEVLVSELGLLKEKLKIETENKIQLARVTNSLAQESRVLRSEEEIISKEKKDIETKKEKREEIIREIEKKQALISGKKTLEERLKKEISLMQKETEIEIDFSYERLESVTNLLTKHKNLLEERNNEFIKIETILSSLELKKEAPLKLKEKVMKIENCPTCFQSVGNEHKDKISKKTDFEIEDVNQEIEQKLVLKKQLERDIEKEKELVRGYDVDYNLLIQNKIKFEQKKNTETKIKSDIFVLERTTNEINSLEKECDILKAQDSKDYEEEYKIMTLKSDDVLTKIRKNEIEFAKKNKELELTKVKLNEIANDVAKKEKTKDDLIHLRSLQDWMQDKFLMMIGITEKNVLSKIREEFSLVFSNWFNMLVSDNLSVRLDEDFTPLVLNQDYEMDYSFLSGGERTAVALSYRLALNQVLNSLISKIKTKDIVILDEPTDGFASEQIDKMRDLFSGLQAEQLIIVSHEQKIEGFVDHVVKIKKDFASIAEKMNG